MPPKGKQTSMATINPGSATGNAIAIDSRRRFLTVLRQMVPWLDDCRPIYNNCWQEHQITSDSSTILPPLSLSLSAGSLRLLSCTCFFEVVLSTYHTVFGATPNHPVNQTEEKNPWCGRGKPWFQGPNPRYVNNPSTVVLRLSSQRVRLWWVA